MVEIRPIQEKIGIDSFPLEIDMRIEKLLVGICMIGTSDIKHTLNEKLNEVFYKLVSRLTYNYII